jgi:hypothetical protein
MDAAPVPEADRWPPWTFGSGPAAGALFGQLFALLSLVAWLSLGVQVQLLIGSRGLLPVAELVQAVRAQGGASWFQLPTIFLWAQSDTALTAGVAAGVMLCVAALLGVRRRLCFALSTALYLSYATACRVFLSFQWDNLLLECGLLAAFLPARSPAPLVHLLFRLVLFKLYFESGLAKWQSPLHDWHDGSAMTYYYETAPLPTFLAWRAHHLPVWWHHFESWATLVLELVVPFGIFGPRRARLTTAGIFTAFQVGNAATANYGFFCHLALALNVFLLDDADVERGWARLAPLVPPRLRRLAARLVARRVPRSPAPAGTTTAAVRRWAAWAGVTAFVVISAGEALFTFAQPGPVVSLLAPILEVDQTFRLVNTYHLFASITRQRIEPELQTLPEGAVEDDEGAWAAQQLWHKPGDVRRAPDFVAPHQPRVDFQLWFYGLSFQRREPPYVSTLVERMCEDPAAVQRLFRAPLPPHPRAVRLVYWQYQFTSPVEARTTGAWWRRTRLAASRAVPCPVAAPP